MACPGGCYLLDFSALCILCRHFFTTYFGILTCGTEPLVSHCAEDTFPLLAWMRWCLCLAIEAQLELCGVYKCWLWIFSINSRQNSSIPVAPASLKLLAQRCAVCGRDTAHAWCVMSGSLTHHPGLVAFRTSPCSLHVTRGQVGHGVNRHCT